MSDVGAFDPTAREVVDEFRALGIVAFTTTRQAGDFALPPGEVGIVRAASWVALHRSLEPAVPGLVSAVQVHGTAIAEHTAPWQAVHRMQGFDAQLVRTPGAAAVTVADCVPVFVAHPDGTVAIAHAGWRGTAARILPALIERITAAGRRAADLHVHLGPAICGRCYEVGPEVYRQLTGWDTIRHRHVDLRALLGEQARESGVGRLSATLSCTRCDNDRFFSHRAGDPGRQVAVISSANKAAPSP
ncbi:MAG: polyphenol oxidase family protein [Gemmatimonadota bacterium]|nr:polyphenol oxidase family protein [Gemmatimonadota bacterium]